MYLTNPLSFVVRCNIKQTQEGSEYYSSKYYSTNGHASNTVNKWNFDAATHP